MSLRLPQNLSTRLSRETGAQSLQHELNAEIAASLGRAGRSMEEALNRLRAMQSHDPGRDALVSHAAHLVWAFFVQRDVIGLRDQEQVIAHYAIPGEVLAHVGERR
jgi:hypothetical protein